MNNRPTRILMAEDSEDDAVLVLNEIRRYGFEPEGTRVMEASDFKEALQSEEWDLVLCDYVMPRFDALSALEIFKESFLDIPFIIVSGTIGEDVAVEALKHGASDYILKQNLTRLGPAIDHELRDAEDRRFRRMTESFAQGQTEVLEMIIEGQPVPQILKYIAERIEQLSPIDTLCSIMLIDSEGTHLELGAAPNLPEEYLEAINPLPIREGLGSCGTAAALRKPVLIEDISTHPDWTPVHHLVRKYGLKSCWALPILSKDQELLGTMGIYHRTPRSPSDNEFRWVEGASKLVSVALEQSRTSQATKLLSNRLVTTLESITDAFYTLDLNWNFTYLNAEAERLLKRSRQELLGRAIWDEFPESTGSALEREYHTAVVEQRKVSFEVYYSPLEKWFSVDAHPSPDGLAVYFHDCSARRKAEEHLKLLETCIAYLNDIIIVTEAANVDEPGPRILFVNEAFVRRTGYAKEEVLGRSPRCLQGEGTDPAELLRIRKALLHGKPVRAEVINYTKSGESFWLELEIVPVRNAEQDLVYWVAVGRDIEGRKKSEAALQQRNAELERFHRLSVGRELQMVELKKEINRLAIALGNDPPHNLTFLDALHSDSPTENQPHSDPHTS